MTASSDRRRRFGDVFLVALLSLVAASGCTGGDNGSTPAAGTTPTIAAGTPTGASTPTPAPVAPTATGAPATSAAQSSGGGGKPADRTANTAYFQLPTGRVGCHMEPTWVRCDVQDPTYKLPAKPANCEGSYGSSLRFDKGKVAQFLCSGDSLLPAPEVLPYGSTITVNRIKCFSENPGLVSCYDLDSGHGVALSPKEYRFLAPS
jgi:hypothetical protein